MADFIVWPADLLVPRACQANVQPFTRSGGRSLGGVKPSTRTDLGYWRVTLDEIMIHSGPQQRTFEAIKGILGGAVGRVAVPVYAPKRVPYASGAFEPVVMLPHDDDTLFDDGTGYLQGAVSAQAVGSVPLASTVMSLRMIAGSTDVAGCLFSYGHALYSIAQVLSQAGDVLTVRISPAVRELIPDGAELEFDEPTCLCNLADDSGMDDGETFEGYQVVSVSFNEDVDYWSLKALGDL